MSVDVFRRTFDPIILHWVRQERLYAGAALACQPDQLTAHTDSKSFENKIEQV
jgi:hypothetical protein